MNKHIPISLACVILLCVPTVNADISWTGNVNGDVFNEANWDLSASSVTTIEPNVSIEDNIQVGPGPFTFWPMVPDLSGQKRFQIGDGNVLNLISGDEMIDDFCLCYGMFVTEFNESVGGAPGSTNGPTVNVSEGFLFASWFVVSDTTVNVASRGTAILGASGNPLSRSVVDLSPDAELAFMDESTDDFRAEHLSKITVSGAPAVEGSNLLVEEIFPGSTVVIGIPEPSSITLTFFGTLALLAFRRK